MQKVKFLFIIFFLILCTNAYSQSAGVNFTIAFPQGDFKENVDNTGFGLSGDFLFLTPKRGMPFGVGINGGFISYGQERRYEPFSPNIPEVTVEVERTNNIANFHLLFRIAPAAGKFIPYLEGLFGGAYLFTETSVRSEYNNEPIATSENFSDWAWSYGFGGGLSYLVSGDMSGDNTPVFIDLKARYLLGSRAEYLKEGSVTIQNGQVYYDINESKTDLLTLHLGVIVYFKFNG